MTDDLVVITSCTASKLELAAGADCVAESFYSGQQHVRLMRGVQEYRAAAEPAGALRLRILSAFYGLLSPQQRITAYNHSFAGKPVQTIRREAREKHVPEAIHEILRQPFAAALLLLSDPYLRACDLSNDLRLGGPVVSFCSPAAARRMPNIAGLRTVALSNADTRRFACGLISLKGELGGRVLTRLAAGPGEISVLTSPTANLLDWLEPTSQMPLSEAA